MCLINDNTENCSSGKISKDQKCENGTILSLTEKLDVTSEILLRE